eukprot:scaffold77438_cov40-Phaeocystis_antarctica.AAC.1
MLLVPAVHLHVHPALAAHATAVAAVVATVAAAAAAANVAAVAAVTALAASLAAHAARLHPDGRRLLHDRERLLRCMGGSSRP